MLVENPVVIVEVLSPSTGRRDQGRKLADYFRLPSVAHYLIIAPDEMLVIHHQRRADDDILTRILRDGTIVADPPGFEVKVAEIYGAGPNEERETGILCFKIISPLDENL